MSLLGLTTPILSIWMRKNEMAKIREMTREEIIDVLTRDYICSFTDTDELDTFVKNVLTFGWGYKPYNEMTDEELLAEWDKEINHDGELPVSIFKKV